MSNGLYQQSDIVFDGKKFITTDGLYHAQSDTLGLWTWQKTIGSRLKVPAYENYMDGAFFSHQEALEKINEYLMSQI